MSAVIKAGLEIEGGFANHPKYRFNRKTLAASRTSAANFVL